MLIPLINRVPKNIIVFANRADYKAKLGVEAPLWDSSSPVKDWIDQTVNLDPETEIPYVGVSYDTNGRPNVDGSIAGPGIVKTAKFSLFPEVAQSVNLLEEPLRPLAAMTPLQAKMVSRRRSWPIELHAGEKLVLDPDFHDSAMVDDGNTAANDPTVSPVLVFQHSALDLLMRIAAKVGA